MMNPESSKDNAAGPAAGLILDNLNRSYDNFAISNLSLTLNAGQILCLLGPSGCGKTTLLRLVAGLETLDKGTVWVDSQDVTPLPVHKRQFGMMFQDLALFPHKSVRENVAYGLQMSKLPGDRIQARTASMLALVGLENMAHRNVADLSGGEQQRVALARSLAPRPRLLMLDEPLGALDRFLRDHLLQEIRRILKELRVTTIFVTHDQTEALTMGDVVGIMKQGRLLQMDSPRDLYLKPRHSFVARFLGFQNLIPGQVLSGGAVKTDLGSFAGADHRVEPGRPVTVVLRPEVAKNGPGDGGAGPYVKLSGVVQALVFSGQQYHVQLKLGADRVFRFNLPNSTPPPKTGQGMGLWIDPADVIVIQEGGAT